MNAEPTAGLSQGFSVVAAPGAPAMGGDPTRRWAIGFPDGRARMAGLTRIEADRLIPLVRAELAERWDDLLAEVTLPVVVSDGAGPYLLDAAGRLVLVLGAHRRLAGMSLAMGQPSPDHRLGVVVPVVPARLWLWRAGVSIGADQRVAGLDELDIVADPPALAAWARRFGGRAAFGSP